MLIGGSPHARRTGQTGRQKGQSSHRRAEISMILLSMTESLRTVSRRLLSLLLPHHHLCHPLQREELQTKIPAHRENLSPVITAAGLPESAEQRAGADQREVE